MGGEGEEEKRCEIDYMHVCMWCMHVFKHACSMCTQFSVERMFELEPMLNKAFYDELAESRSFF